MCANFCDNPQCPRAISIEPLAPGRLNPYTFPGMMPRTIVHIDLDAFYCAVEEQRTPELHGKAFAVGGQPDQRGVVASCSYPARQRGVHSAMAMARALTLCPDLIIVPSRHADYRAASERVMALLRSLTPQVEQLSIDEAFMDVTGVVQEDRPSRSPHAIARYLQNRIQQDFDLSCSVGVASNKMVAKIATDHGKASATPGLSPHAICVVPSGQEAAFLAPLPLTALWGVGPKMAEHLSSMGLVTIADVAQAPAAELMRRFGRNGHALSQHARGIDQRELVTTREAKSISSETTFVHDVQEWDVLIESLAEQAGEVAAQLQKHHLLGTTIRLKLRWADFSTPTRQVTLPYATAELGVIREMATQLLRVLWHSQQPVRLLGVGMSGLSKIEQLSLWSTEDLQGIAAVPSSNEAASASPILR